LTDFALNRAPADPRPAKGWIAALAATPKDALAAALVFLAVALLDARAMGGLSGPIYWGDWHDQSAYLTSAQAFAHGDLQPARHWYPLLYPLALSPFSGLPAVFGAAIPDALCYAFAYLGFRQVAARFGVSPLIAFGLFVVSTLVGAPLAKAWVAPWTSTLSAALIWLGLARACRAWDPLEPPRGLFAAGALLGLIPLCRPADVVVSAILAGLILVREGRSPRRIAALIGGGASVVAAYGALHLAVYGAQASDYMKLSAAIGFDFGHLGWRAKSLLVYAGPFYPYGASFVERFPWLLLGAAGWLVACVRPERRKLALLLGAPVLAYAALMLAYEDLTPSNLWAFRLNHYFKWLLPAFALFGYDFVRGFARAKATSLAALGLVVAASAFQYEAVAVGPDEPADLVVFAAPDAEIDRTMTGVSIVADRQGTLRNLLDYHQVPNGRGLVYAQASRRPFAGGEIWRDSPAEVSWPVQSPAPVEAPKILGAQGRAPLARYRAALAFGVPCWLSRRACDRSLPGLPH
jgi:hypothetical protein